MKNWVTSLMTDGNALTSEGADLYNQGQYDEALERFEQAATVVGEEPVLLLAQGHALLALDQLARALAHYDQAIRAGERTGGRDGVHQGEAHAGRAKALNRLGLLDQASESYRDAIAHRPDPSWMLLLAHVQFQLDRSEEAAASLEQAIASGGDSRDVRRLHAEILLQSGRPIEADESARIGLATNTTDHVLWTIRATANYVAHQPAAALHAIGEALVTTTQPGPALLRQALILIELDRLADAARSAHEAEMACQDNRADLVSGCLVHADDPEAAKRRFAAVLASDLDGLTAAEQAECTGLALLGTGRCDDAIASAQQHRLTHGPLPVPSRGLHRLLATCDGAEAFSGAFGVTV